MAADPWEFGWTPLLSILQMAITVGIAGFGFQTFRKWKRDKIEEKRMELAAEALRLAYDSRSVFERVRNSGSFGFESSKRKRVEGETQEQARRRDTFYVPLFRLDLEQPLFIDIQSIIPKIMAYFGPDKRKLFDGIKTARARIIAASNTMSEIDGSPRNLDLQERCRRDIWDGYAEVPDGEDEIRAMIENDIKAIEQIFLPLVRH